jgi:CRISPR-associated exonuclease Cas4
MFSDDELLPLSALQHLFFCERQCALIHVEQVWAENLYTAEGRIMHERVDSGFKEIRGSIRIECAVILRSYRLGLVGKADVVEFHKKDLPGGKTEWHPFPVEYKRGRPKKDDCDKVQLCAQAICLEEMTGQSVMKGAIFYGKTRRRQDVFFDEKLRTETETLVVKLHRLIDSRKTPRPIYSKKCDSCSFVEICLPRKLSGKVSAIKYLSGMIEDL